MHAAIAAIWQRGLPQTRERVALLRRAAGELASTGTLPPQLRTEAAGVAHKLAGSLGMFGFHQASELARAIEQVLDAESTPDAARFAALTEALSSSLKDHLAN